MKKSEWYISVQWKFYEILHRELFDERMMYSLELDLLPDLVKKLEKHSKECEKCQQLQSNVIKGLEYIECFLEENPFLRRTDDISVLEQKKLHYYVNKQNLRPLRNHLIDAHGYFLTSTFRTRFMFYAVIVSLILHLFNIPFWHVTLSLAIVLVGYVIGDRQDKAFRATGRFIERFDFRDKDQVEHLFDLE